MIFKRQSYRSKQMVASDFFTSKNIYVNAKIITLSALFESYG